MRTTFTLDDDATALAQKSIDEVMTVLRNLLEHPGHRLVPLDFPFEAAIGVCTRGVVGHRQVTDAYLLTAAMRAGMKLLTVDSGLGTLLSSSAERSTHIELLRWFRHFASRWWPSAPAPAHPPARAG